jgi:hypothetical protein
VAVIGVLASLALGGVTIAATPAGASAPKKVTCSKNHKKMTKQACKKLVVKKTPMTKAQYATEYVAISRPANDALTTMKQKAGALGNNSSQAALTAIIEPAVTATQTALAKLAAIKWPGQAETDVRALITIDGTLDGDLSALESVTPATVSSVETKLQEDLGTAQSASDLVHGDLGIPITTP